MAAHDPYVEPPSEARPRPLLAPLRTWLIVAIIVLLLLSLASVGFVQGRQDPALQIPADALEVPAATES